MTHFNYLDALLKEKLELITSKSNMSNISSPYYLSYEDALYELNKPTNFELPRLDDLVKKLQLSKFEKDVLLILFAVEIDPKYERIYAYIQDDMNKKYPTVQLISSLLENTTTTKKDILNYFISDSKLSLLNLFEFIPKEYNHTLFSQQLQISKSLSSFFLDNFRLDSRLSDYCKFNELDCDISSNDTSVDTIKKNIQENQSYLFNIISSSTKENLQKAQDIAMEFGFGLLVISSSHIDNALNTSSMLKMLLRDALLSNSFLYFENFDSFLEQRRGDESLLFDQLAQLSWISFFATTQVWSPEKIPSKPLFITLEPKIKSQSIFQEKWYEALKSVDENLATTLSATLAYNFKFDSEKIDDVCRLIEARKVLNSEVNKKEIFTICRSRVKNSLESYAQYLPSKHNFHDIIVPDEQKKQLKEIISHYKHQLTVFEKWDFKKHFQSMGLGVLFSGASGTGKTMAASILANALGLELYRIELSKIVSKYIGETEKNLSKIFEVAEESGIVLFFDEADAIFGKRSEVKDAHDRYANIEVSYLLQKIEEYDGLVILASNFKNNIDEAFVRRMRFIVDFPLPDEKEREKIWNKMFSEGTSTKDIDFNLLSKSFKLSGANIRNAALYAAFNAVEKDEELTIGNIISGVKSELRKIGKPIREKDFEVYKK